MRRACIESIGMIPRYYPYAMHTSETAKQRQNYQAMHGRLPLFRTCWLLCFAYNSKIAAAFVVLQGTHAEMMLHWRPSYQQPLECQGLVPVPALLLQPAKRQPLRPVSPCICIVARCQMPAIQHTHTLTCAALHDRHKYTCPKQPRTRSQMR